MIAEFDMPFPHYRCPTCGKDLPLGEAKMTVTCADHTDRKDVDFTVRSATSADQAAIETICDRALGETVVDAFGGTYDILDAVNLMAETEGELVGLLSIVVRSGEATIVFMSVYPEYQGTGVGSALLKAADELVMKRNLQFLRVSTTNDDIPLLYFYQRHGFTIYEVCVGEVADKFGSATPGFSGIPVRDEIRMRRAACHTR